MSATVSKRRRGIDNKCFDLAEHFLQDMPGATPNDVAELAGNFQRVAENICWYVEEHERQRKKKLIEENQQ